MNRSAEPRRESSYATLASPGRAELRVQRSRFAAQAVPADAAAEARDRVAEFARLHHDCRHVCFGWRGGWGGGLRELRSDGGEPSGTAGEPILGALREAGVSDALVVVARWFGGVKLGTGGLGRAYAAAAAAALAAAPRRTVVPGDESVLVLTYASVNTVAHLLARHGGRSVAQTFDAAIRWRIWLPRAERREFARALQEATAGAVKLEAPAAEPEPRAGGNEPGV